MTSKIKKAITIGLFSATLMTTLAVSAKNSPLLNLGKADPTSYSIDFDLEHNYVNLQNQTYNNLSDSEAAPATVLTNTGGQVQMVMVGFGATRDEGDVLTFNGSNWMHFRNYTRIAGMTKLRIEYEQLQSEDNRFYLYLGGTYDKYTEEILLPYTETAYEWNANSYNPDYFSISCLSADPLKFHIKSIHIEYSCISSYKKLTIERSSTEVEIVSPVEYSSGRWEYMEFVRYYLPGEEVTVRITKFSSYEEFKGWGLNKKSADSELGSDAQCTFTMPDEDSTLYVVQTKIKK